MAADPAPDRAPSKARHGGGSSAGAFACVARAWEAHEAELRGYLKHRLSDPDATADVLHDVFVKAMRQGRGFCLLANPRAWLFQVARTIAELPLEDARILRACDLDGQTQHDYAQAHGLSLPAAKSRLLRACQRLRGRLAKVCRVHFEADGSVCGHSGRAAP